MIKWFIGYDKAEAVAAYTLAHSIQAKSSMPVSFSFINRDNLKGIFTRARGDKEATDFSISRFLTPYLCGYEGWAVFSDCDMIVQDDPAKLWARRDDKYAVMVAKKEHKPKNSTKFLGQPQSCYEKKNWSAVMLMNCAKCTELTPESVNSESGMYLHQFKWLEGDHLIGNIPQGWNHLVGYDDPKVTGTELVHYTEGTPCLPGYEDCDFSDLWFETLEDMNFAVGESIEPPRKRQ